MTLILNKLKKNLSFLLQLGGVFIGNLSIWQDENYFHMDVSSTIDPNTNSSIVNATFNIKTDFEKVLVSDISDKARKFRASGCPRMPQDVISFLIFKKLLMRNFCF